MLIRVADLVGVDQVGKDTDVISGASDLSFTLEGIGDRGTVLEGLGGVDGVLTSVVETGVASTEAKTAVGSSAFGPEAVRGGALDGQELGGGGVLFETPLDLLVTEDEVAVTGLGGEDGLIESVISEVVDDFAGDTFAHVSLEAEVEATHESVAEVDRLAYGA